MSIGRAVNMITWTRYGAIKITPVRRWAPRNRRFPEAGLARRSPSRAAVVEAVVMSVGLPNSWYERAQSERSDRPSGELLERRLGRALAKDGLVQGRAEGITRLEPAGVATLVDSLAEMGGRELAGRVALDHRGVRGRAGGRHGEVEPGDLRLRVRCR